MSTHPPARSRFLPESRIEEDANLLLAEFARDHEPITVPPVPVDELLELQLKLTFELGDLRARCSNETMCSEPSGLAPAPSRLIRPSIRGREPSHAPAGTGSRFAHEVAHWRLHRQYFEDTILSSPCAVRRPGQARRSCAVRAKKRSPRNGKPSCHAGHLLMHQEAPDRRMAAMAGKFGRGRARIAPGGRVFGDKDPDSARMEMFCRPLAQAIRN